jgi:anti-anti-sigma factor
VTLGDNLLRIDISRDSAGMRIVLAGDVDLDTEGRIADAVAGLPEDPGAVTVDLTDVGFIGLTGLARLEAARADLVGAGGRFRLVGVSDFTRQVMATVALDELGRCCEPGDDGGT